MTTNQSLEDRCSPVPLDSMIAFYDNAGSVCARVAAASMVAGLALYGVKAMADVSYGLMAVGAAGAVGGLFSGMYLVPLKDQKRVFEMNDPGHSPKAGKEPHGAL